MIHIPDLEHGSNSWIVSRTDGTVIGEFWERSNVAKFNPATCIVETSGQYLRRINRQIKATQKD
jgi:hypothetical protein